MTKETLSIKDILTRLEATEDGILLIPESDVAIVDERDLEEFDIPETLKDSKIICFWTTDEVRNYFSIKDDKMLWFDNELSAPVSFFEGNVKEDIVFVIDDRTFDLKILSDDIVQYEDRNFFEDREIEM